MFRRPLLVEMACGEDRRVAGMEETSSTKTIGLPSPDEALQFCIMLQAGLPAEQAILYFTDSTDPGDIAALLGKWTRSRSVKAAQQTLLGKGWQEMTLEERIDCGLNYHYNSLAFLLFSTNYSSVGPTDKAKLDSARQALEAKKAGTAGQGDALSRFMDDFRAGKLGGGIKPLGFTPKPS
jgi:hypothetical protein